MTTMFEKERTQLAEHRAVVDGVIELLPGLHEITMLVCDALSGDGRLYTFGNGGSAADAQHLAAELVGRYRLDRRSLPALALTVDPSVMTCIANDYAYDDVFARQVQALAGPADVVVGFTTSGRSPSVVRGLEAARVVGARTVLFTGGDGGSAIAYADHALVVASTNTARIQEAHLLMLHILSEGVDTWAAATAA